jgi:hypothetical protein
MKRLLWCVVVGAAACGDGGGPSASPKVVIRPVLDSLFVGDTDTARTVIYLDANGDTMPAGPVRWSSTAPTALKVDSVSGQLTALARGAAILTATANGVAGHALVVVADTLDLALVLDTIYLLPTDTITIPVVVQRKGGSPPAATFGPSPNSGVYTIDTVTGLVTGVASGSPLRYFVHAGTLADTGAIVIRAADTASANSRSFFSVSGTANRHTGGLAYAINYAQHGGAPAFQLRAYNQNGSGGLVDNLLFTVVSAVDTAAPFVIDSISPVEAFGKGADAVCRPPRAWATWTTYSVSPPVTGLSRHTGLLTITKVVSAPGGTALGGRFQFLAQRTDMYGDALGAVTVVGTFVAPLYANLQACP